ncbi:MAG: peptidylprolyl isomerase [Nitrospiraceae bacterium]|nr:peptidylprolyl isomerase [Nitrospiraceae bacterium]
MAVKKNDKVKIDYTGTFDDGSVFDTSIHGDHSHPIEFVVGSGTIIKGFDDAVIGMEVGDEKEFTVSPKEGYGDYNPELKTKISKKQLPEGQEPKKGMTLMVKTPEGQSFPVKILDVTGDEILLDLNHPLAGKTLHFKIKLVGVESA